MQTKMSKAVPKSTVFYIIVGWGQVTYRNYQCWGLKEYTANIQDTPYWGNISDTKMGSRSDGDKVTIPTNG